MENIQTIINKWKVAKIRVLCTLLIKSIINLSSIRIMRWGGDPGFFFWSCHLACGISVPWSELEPWPLAVRVRSPDHWTTREFPILGYLRCNAINPKSPRSERGKWKCQSQVRRVEDGSASWSDVIVDTEEEGRGHEPRDACNPRKSQGSRLSPRASKNSLVLAKWDLFQTCDLQKL